MASSYKGYYTPINPGKYAGKTAPYLRSTWEMAFARMCDTHPSVLYWVSEPFKIPYKNPITHLNTVYVPDFLVVYRDAKGKRHAEVVEIKPKKETYVSEAKSMRSKTALAINVMKWKAAQVYCSRNGFTFRVITEDQIFRKPK